MEKTSIENLELGNMLLNTNDIQEYKCENYIIALLDKIDLELQRVMWNINQEEYESPFNNTANSFKNNVFEVQSYSWDEKKVQPYNFKYKDIEISWYKYLGRDTTINKEITPKEAIEMFDECLESIYEMEREFERKEFEIEDEEEE